MTKSREIKFRAWSKEEQKMVMVGGLANMDYEIDNRFRYITIASKDVGVLSKATPQIQTVELMQYTGLADKNGQEIYEGDILAVWLGAGKSRKQYPHEVKWIADLAEFRLPAPLKEFEIIGNIYENPELLK